MPDQRYSGRLPASAMLRTNAGPNDGAAMRRRSSLALGIFVVYLIFLQIYYVAIPQASSSLLDELLFIIMAAWAFRAYKSTKRLQQAFVLFVLYSGVTLAGNVIYRYGGVPQPWAALLDLTLDIKPFFIEAGFAYLFMKSRNAKGDMEAICIAVIILAMLNSVFVLHDLTSSGVSVLGRTLGARNGLYQPIGLQLNQVRSAALTMLGATFAIYFAITRRSLVAQAAAIYLGTLVFAHQSAKELAAFLLVFPFFLANRKQRTSRIAVWVFGLAGLGLVGFATPIGTFFIERVTFFIGDSGLDKARTQLFVRGFTIAQDHFPFGTGAGTFGSGPSYQLGYSEVYYKYGFDKIYGATPNFSVFLQDAFWGKIIGQSGFIGLIIYLALIAVALTPPFLLDRRSNNLSALPACAACLLALLTSTASSPFSDDFVGVVTAAFAGYALAALAQMASRSSPRRLPGPARAAARAGARFSSAVRRPPGP